MHTKQTLDAFLKTPLPWRHHILSDRKVVDCLCECIGNLIRGTLPLSAKETKRLRSKARLLRRLGTPKTPWTVRKRLLQQQGQGLWKPVFHPLLRKLKQQ